MKTILPYLPILTSCPLFHGVSENDIHSMITCLSASIKDYDKNQYILRTGDRTASIGLVLVGDVHIVKEDFWGNRSIMADIRPGELFGEAYAMSGAPLEISAMAMESVRVMFFDSKKIARACPSSCAYHTTLIQNLLRIITKKTLFLTQKIEILSNRTTREKLLSYLSAQAVRSGSPSFEIPFNRTQLAEYLSVDRSAMTTELGRMQDEGLLDFEKNHFELRQRT
jgi:CRP-like cAMP-binding protein